MNKQPEKRKSLREFVKGLSIWAKIGWTILLGYIVGRILYWLFKMMS
ncbi:MULTISPECIES: hypothetical protein [Brevibacillus]|nr:MULTISPECIES: hypothetical protein [Bacillales]NRR02347.1 hypothetical protein [Brevibacillus sp. RS1.1]UIO43835.1 hypothetical protein LOY85_06675 [Brevibacillus brevis]WGV61486.1 hypothetical protein QIH01_10185 [Brevibacillus brevis]